MQNINDDTIKTSDTPLKKNIPLTLFETVRKGYSMIYCGRELETEQNCNILTPTIMATTAFLSRSPGLLNRGPGDPASLGHVLVPASSLQLQLLNRGPEGTLCWVLAFSTTTCLQLTDFLSSPGLYNNLTSTLPPASVTVSYSFNPSTVKFIIF